MAGLVNPSAVPVALGIASQGAVQQINSAGNTQTSHVCTLPAAKKGQMFVLLHVLSTSTTRTIPGGWTLLGPAFSTRAVLIGRICDGTEGSTLTITTAAGCESFFVPYVLDGVDPDVIHEHTATSTGTNTSPDQASISPSWGADKDTLIMVPMALAGTSKSVTSYPSGYTLGQVNALTGTNQIVLGANCAKLFRAASEDPGAYSVSAGSPSWFTTAVVFKGMTPGP